VNVIQVTLQKSREIPRNSLEKRLAHNENKEGCLSAAGFSLAWSGWSAHAAAIVAVCPRGCSPHHVASFSKPVRTRRMTPGFSK
jgi:hypothetical protein